MTLICTAVNDAESPYDAKIVWYGPTGRVIENNDNISVTNVKTGITLTSALKFKPINHKQTGMNKCKASNHPSSSNEANIRITVECKSHKLLKLYTYVFLLYKYMCILYVCIHVYCMAQNFDEGKF